MLFMKEISSSGNVNTVDVIFPSWSFWMYANPALGKYLLMPLYECMQSGLYPNTWSAHDVVSSDEIVDFVCFWRFTEDVLLSPM